MLIYILFIWQTFVHLSLFRCFISRSDVPMVGSSNRRAANSAHNRRTKYCTSAQGPPVPSGHGKEKSDKSSMTNGELVHLCKWVSVHHQACNCGKANMGRFFMSANGLTVLRFSELSKESLTIVT